MSHKEITDVVLSLFQLQTDATFKVVSVCDPGRRKVVIFSASWLSLYLFYGKVAIIRLSFIASFVELSVMNERRTV